MDLSTFVAQVLAVVYLSVGVGMLLDKAYYKKLFSEVFSDHLGMYLGGIMALVAGVALVSYHNVWSQDWTVLVTIIGWLALIKGVMLLAFPSVFMKQFKGFAKTKYLHTMSFVVLALGLVFGYFGFMV